jgi:hypothetical protein
MAPDDATDLREQRRIACEPMDKTTFKQMQFPNVSNFL